MVDNELVLTGTPLEQHEEASVAELRTPMTGWRGVLKIHPAADLFPPMGPEELQALGEDIKVNGLHNPVTTWQSQMVDGRSRLDAMELVGLPTVADGKLCVSYDTLDDGADPFAFAISVNVHRRHLTKAQKDEVIAALLKAKPERSDRATAKLARTDHKTVGTQRRRLEATGEIPQSERRTGADNKARALPTRRPILTLARVPPVDQNASETDSEARAICGSTAEGQRPAADLAASPAAIVPVDQTAPAAVSEGVQIAGSTTEAAEPPLPFEDPQAAPLPADEGNDAIHDRCVRLGDLDMVTVVTAVDRVIECAIQAGDKSGFPGPDETRQLTVCLRHWIEVLEGKPATTPPEAPATAPAPKAKRIRKPRTEAQKEQRRKRYQPTGRAVGRPANANVDAVTPVETPAGETVPTA
jgi:hypothetical protein